MRNIFAFLRKHSNLLFFLFLEVLSLYFLFSYNKFHQAAFMGTANELTGSVFSQYNKVEGYFSLRKENERLSKENTRLINLLKEDYSSADTTNKVVTDTIPIDTLGTKRKYLYMQAEVVHNSTNLPNNFITLHRGSNQGVKRDMGVYGPGGIVGVVVDVSSNFSVVMSLLHKQSNTSVKIKKTGESGKLEWDGTDASILTLRDIPKSVKLQKGDTVLTSQYSDKFPPNLMVGTIAQIIQEQSTNNYLLKIKSATDFKSIQTVWIIDNMQREEQKELEEKVKNKK
ncbi:MAG: rod shape-determining protein MreC [Sphingobacteriales bacterium]|nr:rod shape-determining protein MreC [Sphingobacteriales bacterium]MBI3720340.1 rod shape-determining protein MreC [Sphingobacteriales bacterium]